MTQIGSRVKKHRCRQKPLVSFTLGLFKQEAERMGFRLILPKGREQPYCQHVSCVGTNRDVLHDSTPVILIRSNGREVLFHAKHRYEQGIEVVPIRWRDFVPRVAEAVGYDLERIMVGGEAETVNENARGSRKDRPVKRFRPWSARKV